MGHEYICYSPLLNRNASVLYEGKPVGTPDPGQFFRVISEYDVAGMFTAPTAIRAIKREDQVQVHLGQRTFEGSLTMDQSLSLENF